MTTTTKDNTIRGALDRSDLNSTADALKAAGAGTALSKVLATVTGLAAATAVDITDPAVKAAATVVGLTLNTDENLPAVGSVVSVRVTAGVAAAGVRTVGDEGATPSATVVALSNDGTTLTFEADVTAFVLQYRPAPKVPMNTDFPLGAP